MGWEDASHFINQITESATLLLVRIFSRKKLVEISILPTQAWGVGGKEKEKNTGWVSELKIAALFLQELLTLMITFSDHLNARFFYIYIYKKNLSCYICSELEGHKTLL